MTAKTIWTLSSDSMGSRGIPPIISHCGRPGNRAAGRSHPPADAGLGILVPGMPMDTLLTAEDFSEARIADPALLAKYRLLKGRLAALGEAVIGFSGGVDSAFLAAVA